MSPDSFSLYNQGVTANVVDPPIMTQNLVANYPNVVAQYGATPNALLTAYETYGQTSGWDVQEYGGNTVTFTLKTPTANSYWMSHDSSGQAYGNCKMRPGEVYDLSLWVRTTDVTSLSVGAYTGSPNDAKTEATSLRQPGTDSRDVQPGLAAADVGIQEPQQVARSRCVFRDLSGLEGRQSSLHVRTEPEPGGHEPVGSRGWQHHRHRVPRPAVRRDFHLPGMQWFTSDVWCCGVLPAQPCVFCPAPPPGRSSSCR